MSKSVEIKTKIRIFIEKYNQFSLFNDIMNFYIYGVISLPAADIIRQNRF